MLRSKSIFHRVLKSLWWFTMGFVLFAALYFVAASALSSMVVDAELPTSNDIHVYLMTNGVHTDILMPVRSTRIDWSKEILYTHTLANDTSAQFIAVGWGDKGFYLDTPTWSDLSLSTAFKAVFGLGSSAVHTTYYTHVHEGDSCFRISLSHAQYERLVNTILSRFERDERGKVINIRTTAQYGPHDAFYEARGRYNLFHTCNTWTNDALKSCGQKACFWTPFESGVMRLYRRLP